MKHDLRFGLIGPIGWIRVHEFTFKIILSRILFRNVSKLQISVGQNVNIVGCILIVLYIEISLRRDLDIMTLKYSSAYTRCRVTHAR